MAKLNLFDAVPLIVNEQLEGYGDYEIKPYNVNKVINTIFLRTDLPDNANNRATVKTMVKNAINLMLYKSNDFMNMIYEIESDLNN